MYGEIELMTIEQPARECKFVCDCTRIAKEIFPSSLMGEVQTTSPTALPSEVKANFVHVFCHIISCAIGAFSSLSAIATEFVCLPPVTSERISVLNQFTLVQCEKL